uniref:SFRICE_025295 n=1 Tax=Spodoptera frugiperda TaxID=7108 RepID=A0A2H1VRP0_SPOFR
MSSITPRYELTWVIGYFFHTGNAGEAVGQRPLQRNKSEINKELLKFKETFLEQDNTGPQNNKLPSTNERIIPQN